MAETIPAEAQNLTLMKAHASHGHWRGSPLPCVRVVCRVQGHRVADDRPGAGEPESDLEGGVSQVAAAGLKADQAGLAPWPLGVEGRDALCLAPPVQQVAARRSLARQLAPLWLEPVHWLVRLQASAGWPVPPQAVWLEQVGTLPGEPGCLVAVLVLPAWRPQALAAVVPWVFQQLSGHPSASSGARSGEPSPGGAPAGLEPVLASLRAVGPRGTNPRLLQAAAFEQGIPCLPITGSRAQFGWGSRSRWMDSTFTDRTSVVAARTARDKRDAHAVLRRAGLPVPRQQPVATLDQALACAQAWGYPVVLKPADLDGGVGVAAGLGDEAALRRAHERASRHGRPLILETHIPGRDYRLGVMGERLLWATYREPAGVWGDGVHTVDALVAEANRDPRRGTQTWFQMSPIVVDAEATELLAEQGASILSVPQPGEFLRLRRAANVSSGGRPLDVTAKVHPDNARLAARAARVMHLDLAGVDLITPDITRSWREVGGMICEINAQPQLPTTRPQTAGHILQAMVEGSGRIPLVLLLAELPWGDWAVGLRSRLAAQGLRTGFVCGSQVHRADDDEQPDTAPNAFAAVRQLLMDPWTDAAIIATSATPWLSQGLPVDRMDLALADATADPKVRELLGEACPVQVWPGDLTLEEQLSGPPPQREPLLERVAQVVLARARHGRLSPSA